MVKEDLAEWVAPAAPAESLSVVATVVLAAPAVPADCSVPLGPAAMVVPVELADLVSVVRPVGRVRRAQRAARVGLVDRAVPLSYSLVLATVVAVAWAVLAGPAGSAAAESAWGWPAVMAAPAEPVGLAAPLARRA